MTGISTLGQSLDQAERLKNLQLDLTTLQRQITTGKKAEFFKDLGSDTLTTKRARIQVKQVEEFQNNITTAERRIQSMDDALKEINELTDIILNTMSGEGQGGEADMERIRRQADNILSAIEDLVNTQDGDKYLFSGAESRTKPITNTGTMDTFLQTEIGDWVNGSITSDELIQQYRDSSNLNNTLVGYAVPFTGSNEIKNVTVRVAEGTELDYTVKANNPALRDILVGVSAVKNLTESLDEVNLDPDDPTGTTTAPGADRDEQTSNFYEVFHDIENMLRNARDDLNSERSSLQEVQVQMDKINDQHKLDLKVQNDIIGEVEDIDITEASVKINSLINQIQASFRVTSTVSDLSLVNFI